MGHVGAKNFLMRANLIVGALTALALAMAGCAGDFRVRQTEPIRVQIDGEPQETRVAADGANGEVEKTEFQIETPEDVDVVKVMVEVTNVEVEDEDDDDNETTPANTTTETGNETAEAAIILVIVEDQDTGEKLAEQQVEATEQPAQISFDIDIKGRNNVVVVTQAIEGAADVSVSAESADSTKDGGETATTATTTATTAATTTTY